MIHQPYRFVLILLGCRGRQGNETSRSPRRSRFTSPAVPNRTPRLRFHTRRRQGNRRRLPHRFPLHCDEVKDPQGTNNVLKAAKGSGVRRVVVTSSVSAITPSPSWPSDAVKDEDCWADVEYCKQKGLWYPLSKTLAEKAAWEFSKEKGLEGVVVNPGLVMGPIISPGLNGSMLMLLRLLRGCTGEYKDFFMGSVHVKDVALAHISVYENAAATGRHLCVEAISHYGDFAAKVAELYPEYNVPRLAKDTQPGLLRVKDASKKLIDLGLQFIPMEQIIKDAVQSLKTKGFIS